LKAKVEKEEIEKCRRKRKKEEKELIKEWKKKE
jgi:hypothetical protein